ncbi:MAG: HPr family phosphocarrier protein [Candidatus Omnitrophica bacterium]|jgi:phosphotransferase system HPr-like phosphotransfer protein|nr:HPr family phosphocarrier protein [Candidatus Omnitrophota bacterium]
MERIEEEIIVNNPHGLHARPAALLVQIANKFDSRIMLEKDGETVDGKSIIAILSLGVNCGAALKLIIEGIDAKEAFEEIKEFLRRESE